MTVVGGCQGPEATHSVVKGQLHHTGKRRRQHGDYGPHLKQLAGLRRVEAQGIDNILVAFSQYRRWCVEKRIPKDDAFKCKEWLFSQS